MCNKKATFGRALPRRFNVSLLREPHIALPIKDNELIRSSREERERERQGVGIIVSSRLSHFHLKESYNVNVLLEDGEKLIRIFQLRSAASLLQNQVLK